MFNPYSPKQGEIAAATRAREEQAPAVRCEAVDKEGQCDRSAGHPPFDPTAKTPAEQFGKGHMTLTRHGDVVVYVW